MKSVLSPHRRIIAVSTMAAALGLSSCMTENPYTGEQQVSKTTTGAGLGAAGGALLGAIGQTALVPNVCDPLAAVLASLAALAWLWCTGLLPFGPKARHLAEYFEKLASV